MLAPFTRLSGAEDGVISPSWRNTQFQWQGQRQEFSESCLTTPSSSIPQAEALLCVPGSSEGHPATALRRWPPVLFP